MNSVNRSHIFFRHPSIWRIFCGQQCQHFSRSVPGLVRPAARNIAKPLSVSPLLIESAEKRLSLLKQEIDLGNGPVMPEPVDILEETLIKAMTIEHVKELIASHYRNMSAHHVSECMQTIQNLIKYSDDRESLTFDLLASKEFVLLANRALKVARYMEPNEALKTLLIMNKLGISIDTILSQALLQMIRYSINEFSINELHQIVVLIKRIQKANTFKGTLIDALIFALPHAVKNCIQYKEMNFDSPIMLLRCLDMIARFGTENFSDMDALYKCLHFTEQALPKMMNLRDCVQLIAYIYSLKINNTDLLTLCKSISSKCIDRILAADKSEIAKVPSSLWGVVLNKLRQNMQFFDPKFLRFISNCAVDYGNFTDNDLNFILSQNWYFKVVDFKILNYFAEKLENPDSTIYSKDSQISPIKLWQFFALPSDRDQIQADFPLICSNILTSPYFLSQKSRGNYFYFLKNCLILNVKIKEGLLKKWFSLYVESALEEFTSFSQREHFLKLAVYLYNGLLINKNTDDLSEEIRQLIKEKLTPFLEEYTSLLKNELASTQKNPLLEELQYFVTDQFVDWQLTQNYVSAGLVVDLLAERNDQKIGFIILSQKNFCNASHMMTGETQFALDTLRHCGFQTIIIEKYRWNCWSSAEKELFIKNQKQFDMTH